MAADFALSKSRLKLVDQSEAKSLLVRTSEYVVLYRSV